MTESPSELRVALQKQNNGSLQEAQTIYEKIIQKNPTNPLVLHLLGLLYYQQGNFVGAQKLIKQAIAYNPKVVKFYIDLTMVLIAQQQLHEAITLLQDALILAPTNVVLYNRLGNVYKKQNNLVLAEKNYQQAIELDPDFYLAYCNLAMLYHEKGEFEQTKKLYQKIIAQNPRDASVYLQLGHILKAQNLFEEAIEAMNKLIELKYSLPQTYASLADIYKQQGEHVLARNYYQQSLALGNKRAEYQLKVLNKEEVSQIPIEDITKGFDVYANRYDKSLVEVLNTNIPNLLLSAVQNCYGLERRFKQVVEIGCGTGLTGKLFRSSSDYLMGIDLSERMIEQARSKNIYDEVFVGDMVKFLSHAKQTYDLAIAADVLVYCGDLNPIFAVIQNKLVPAGLFVFSTESIEDSQQTYVFNSAGRFSHSRDYIHFLAAKYNFTIKLCQSAKLRKEYGIWVVGDIFVMESGRKIEEQL